MEIWPLKKYYCDQCSLLLSKCRCGASIGAVIEKIIEKDKVICTCVSIDKANEITLARDIHANSCPLKDLPIKIDKVVEAVREDLHKRSQHGIAKYGTSLERKDLSLRDWLQHAYEECLDQANYLKRAIIEIDEKKN